MASYIFVSVGHLQSVALCFAALEDGRLTFGRIDVDHDGSAVHSGH